MASKKILILDDEELIIRSLSKLLEKNGFEVMIVKSGQDALAMVEEENFDLIIADVRMPGMNGLETIQQIYREAEQRGIQKTPTIFITGYADETIEQEARQMKPIDYIYKPFEVSELMEKIKGALGG